MPNTCLAPSSKRAKNSYTPQLALRGALSFQEVEQRFSHLWGWKPLDGRKVPEKILGDLVFLYLVLGTGYPNAQRLSTNGQ